VAAGVAAVVEKELTVVVVVARVVAEKVVEVGTVKVAEGKELQGVVEVEDTALLGAGMGLVVAAKVVDFCEEMVLVLAQRGCQGKERLEKAIGHRFQRGIGIMGRSFLLFCHCFFCFCFYCFGVWDEIELL
jgi:hypothetical protein